MLTIKQIDQKIRRITTNGKKLNELIHETAMAILNHAEKHGDCSRALTLAQAMPASMRRTMLIKWFDTFSPIRIRFNDDSVGMLKPDAKLYRKFDAVQADKTPFYELAERTPEKPPLTDAEIIALVGRLAESLEKKADNGKVQNASIARTVAEKLKGLDLPKPANTGQFDTLETEAAAPVAA